MKVVVTALLKQQDLDTAVTIKVATLSSTSGNSGLIADSFKPRGKNLGTWDILVNFRTDLLLFFSISLPKFNPKHKCDFMLIYFILLVKKRARPEPPRIKHFWAPPGSGGFFREGNPSPPTSSPSLALLFTISNRKGTLFLIPLLIKSTTFTYLVL